VGWFTSIYPVLLDLGDAPTAAESLPWVKEQLRSIPDRGVGYGILRYLADDPELAEPLRRQPEPELSFNYLGQFDQALSSSGPFGPAPEPSGPTQSPHGARRHLLDVAGVVTGGQLHVSWTFGASVHRRETVERFAADFMDALREMIAHCRSAEAGGYTPSDFPLARLDPQALARLVSTLARVDAEEAEEVETGALATA
ncbi:MAG TPA: condensation domain-containing protein, partial [Longimicrobiaceae bacterium]